MTRLFAAIFAGMTAAAGYGTFANFGVQDNSYEPLTGAPSVRLGSSRSGLPTFGGGGGGK